MSAHDTIRRVELFRDLSDADLDVLCRGSAQVLLRPGEVLFAQGDEGDAAYVIVHGAIEILRIGADRETLLAVRHPGEVIGEMALLQDEPRMATARARDDVELLQVPKPALTRLLDTSPTALRGLFDILLERLRTTEALMRQNDRMVQLGTLTAGVAHELNNPAGAVVRAASQLDDAVDRYVEVATASAQALDPDERREVRRLAHRASAATQLSALERSDREQELEDALEELGVDEPWTVAADLVDAGIGPDDLAALDPSAVADALAVVGAGQAVQGLIRSVHDGAERLSTIVGALKSYSFLDQAPVQVVDVAAGLDDTILVMGERLDGIVVERHLAPDLRTIEAHGSELNQVWTNLLHNAADAIAERRATEGSASAGTITITATNHRSGVAVEITDDGAGIPADIHERIFDAFFTTKPPGRGTGLGLDISYRIVAMVHGGDLTFESIPGRTTFRVELPGR